MKLAFGHFILCTIRRTVNKPKTNLFLLATEVLMKRLKLNYMALQNDKIICCIKGNHSDIQSSFYYAMFH